MKILFLTELREKDQDLLLSCNVNDPRIARVSSAVGQSFYFLKQLGHDVELQDLHLKKMQNASLDEYDLIFLHWPPCDLFSLMGLPSLKFMRTLFKNKDKLVRVASDVWYIINTNKVMNFDEHKFVKNACSSFNRRPLWN